MLTAASCGSELDAASRSAVAAGWSVRIDAFDDGSEATRFVLHDDGLEAKPGPNACLWHPDLRTSGAYRLSVDVTHLDSGEHPHGAGLTFGGQDVHGEGQRYTYFLVRSDQKFLIKSRRGDETEDVVSWTEHEALSAEDPQGVTRNRLSVEVGGGELSFLINGVEVHRTTSPTLATEGQVGLRLVHDIHVRFGEIALEPIDGSR